MVVNTTQEVPLQTMPDGTIRIAGSRVSLDSLVYNYCQGATAEEIVFRFPGLRLADVHSCIAYYLNHQEDVDKYLAERERSSSNLFQRLSTDPQQQQGIREMRDRIKAREAERQRKSS